MDDTFDIVLRDARVDAKSQGGDTFLGPDAQQTLPDALIENSVFVLDSGEVEVESGKIEFGEGPPHLIVSSGKSGSIDISNSDFTLPKRVKVLDGRLVPASTGGIAFPEGQTEAREAPKLVHWLLYGKAR
jgi:hypothetical protein